VDLFHADRSLCPVLSVIPIIFRFLAVKILLETGNRSAKHSTDTITVSVGSLVTESSAKLVYFPTDPRVICTAEQYVMQFFFT
jgi:hypothetical protein